MDKTRVPKYYGIVRVTTVDGELVLQIPPEDMGDLDKPVPCQEMIISIRDALRRAACIERESNT